MAICGLIILSNKLKVAYPILLVLAGLGISVIPGMPAMKLSPDLIMLIFLPPILYEAAANNSWKEIWKWRRIISSFAFIVVFITACSVALFANYFIPGVSIAIGFLLGGIVSPPDAVSAAAIMKFVKVPKRLSVILEGESLFNDASSLIIVKFALIAIGIGQIVWYEALGSFVWMVVGGIGAGVLLTMVFTRIQKWMPDDENIDTIVSIVIPYMLYLAAEEIGSSGVLSVVSGGLYFSYHRIRLIKASSRLQAQSVWRSLTFMLNGYAFMLIGLDLNEITTTIQANGVSLWTVVGYGVMITIVLILVRIACAYGAVGVTFVMRNFITVADRNMPGMGAPMLLGWTGMRGVVSLAAALSTPLTLKDGAPFPMRSEILLITFVVILLTLVVQGLTLPLFIKRFHFPDYGDYLPEEVAKRFIRRGLAETSLQRLQAMGECDDSHQSIILHGMVKHWGEQIEKEDPRTLYGDSREVYIDILNEQRLWLNRLNKENPKIDEDLVRHYIHRIDLEEERLRAD